MLLRTIPTSVIYERCTGLPLELALESGVCDVFHRRGVRQAQALPVSKGIAGHERNPIPHLALVKENKLNPIVRKSCC